MRGSKKKAEKSRPRWTAGFQVEQLEGRIALATVGVGVMSHGASNVDVGTDITSKPLTLGSGASGIVLPE